MRRIINGILKENNLLLLFYLSLSTKKEKAILYENNETKNNLRYYVLK